MSTARGVKIPIGKILLDSGKISPDQLKQALTLQKSTTEKLGRLLIDLGFVSEHDVLAAYAQQLNVPMFDPDKMTPDPSVAKVIPDHLIQRYNLIPLRRNGTKLVVAMSDPTNVFALDDLRLITGFEIEPVLATLESINAIRNNGGLSGGGQSASGSKLSAVNPTLPAQEAGSKLSGLGNILPTNEDASKMSSSGALDASSSIASGSSSEKSSTADIDSMLEAIRRPDAPGEGSNADDDSVEIAEDAPIIRMVNVLIQNAIKQGASDIHVEPDRRQVRVRYRIDGVLYEVMTLPKFAHAPLISRLKIMAEMNIAERRIPQDGRIHLRHEKRDFDMRVNVLPTVFGEKCVMRILDQGSVLIGLGRLGFTPEMMASLETLITRPNGMVLATGPTGSGKTTTLYSILNRINSVDKNIITCEDPVEYQLPGVNQVSVNRKAGLTFPVAMRAFLRQDPDIIMVGEIRDLETAEIAVQASLTGHLVLSTLHTNDSPSTIVRLSDMGVEPFLISAAIIGVIAQRLARKLCEHCKEPDEPPRDALYRLGMSDEEIEGSTFFRAVGCEECMNRGYRGRMGVYELLTLTEELQELVVRRAPLSEVAQAAIASGMITLMKDGLAKVKNGLTTLEEVLRVVSVG
ncbi:MAG: GspE/PulE family protein [Armatimonadota bacterium]